MYKIILSILTCAAALGVAEWGLRQNLFENVSYSNSESIDDQLKERDASKDWNLLFVGDSETRWGIDPAQIDAAFSRNGMSVKSFNHAFDGFGPSWWQKILPPLLQQPALQKVEVVAVGVQMIDAHRAIQAPSDNCGALQKPVLTSPFAVDLGIDSLCHKETWDAKLGRDIFHDLWVVRYSSAVRSLLLPSSIFASSRLKFNSAKEGESFHGFEPHRSIGENQDAYEQDFVRWKAQYTPAVHFKPLEATVWPELTAASGFFDSLNNSVTASGRRLVLFALPTNPVVIDTFQRRNDYQRNSELLKNWASKNGVIFIDLGVQDVGNPSSYFSDMRHLSGLGARTYSRLLGEALASAMVSLSSETKIEPGKAHADISN